MKAAPGLSESSVRKDGETQREGKEEEKEEEERGREGETETEWKEVVLRNLESCVKGKALVL